MIFRGGGDCSQVDWIFLGGSIANWSFIAFVGLGLLALRNLLVVAWLHRQPGGLYR
jgi:disulfide bond formation protein DsbB